MLQVRLEVALLSRLSACLFPNFELLINAIEKYAVIQFINLKLDKMAYNNISVGLCTLSRIGDELNIVDNFKYFGSVIDKDYTIDMEVYLRR